MGIEEGTAGADAAGVMRTWADWILSSLSPQVRERVIDAAREAFTSGVATTIQAAALVALVAAGLVMVLWPRPAGHAIGAMPRMRSPVRSRRGAPPTR
jgi:hypothetical protein